MNRNLHTQNKLTEFSREFEEEPETLFSKFVSKVSSAYNSNYNTINVIPPNLQSTSSILSINELPGDDSSLNYGHTSASSVPPKMNTPSPSVSDNTSIDGKSDDSNNVYGSEDSKSSNNVFQMIGNLIPLKNNVSF